MTPSIGASTVRCEPGSWARGRVGGATAFTARIVPEAAPRRVGPALGGRAGRYTRRPMLIGRTHELVVAGRRPDGSVRLRHADGTELGLEPGTDASALPAEDTVRAFVRTDAAGEPVASLALPYVELGRCAALKVVDVGAEGAWLDWGLAKHLLLPFAEQRRPVEPGRIESVLVYLDSSGRLAATARLDHHLDETPEGFRAWQGVELLVYQRTDLGFKAVVDDRAIGLLYADEVFRTIRPGTRTPGWVRRVRPDGRLDLSLQPPRAGRARRAGGTHPRRAARRRRQQRADRPRVPGSHPRRVRRQQEELQARARHPLPPAPGLPRARPGRARRRADRLMAIQWYPGHMHKARREMTEALSGVDALIEVRDARLPYSSANPVLAELGGDRPRLVVLTRADLADPDATPAWLEALASAGADGDGRTAAAPSAGIALDLAGEDAARGVPARLDALAGPAPASREGPRTAMVVGIPNVGKSTLVNRLAGRAVAATGDEPAVTKRQQSVRLAGGAGARWRLRDTPGVLWPNVENPRSGYRLAASGAVRDTAMDSADVALELAASLEALYPDALAARYGTTLPDAPAAPAASTSGGPSHGGPDGGGGGDAEARALATLEAIGRARGCLGGGGLVDFDRAARLLLADFRAGRLGRITLETPAMASAERAETDAARRELDAAREAKREARRTRRRKAAARAGTHR